MISVSEAASGQRLELHVVLGVRCRDDHQAWLRVSEDDLLERCETVHGQVLNHLDRARCVVARETRVSIGQRALEELDALPLSLRHALEIEPLAGTFERSQRDVHPDDLADAPLREERAEQLALATTEVHHTLS